MNHRPQKSHVLFSWQIHAECLCRMAFKWQLQSMSLHSTHQIHLWRWLRHVSNNIKTETKTWRERAEEEQEREKRALEKRRERERDREREMERDTETHASSGFQSQHHRQAEPLSASGVWFGRGRVWERPGRDGVYAQASLKPAHHRHLGQIGNSFKWICFTRSLDRSLARSQRPDRNICVLWSVEDRAAPRREYVRHVENGSGWTWTAETLTLLWVFYGGLKVETVTLLWVFYRGIKGTVGVL